MPPKKKSEAPPPPPRKSDDGPPPEEGLPLWMATFADLVTLLLTFFVLLLSFANTDVQKFRDLMGSVKEAFGVQIKSPKDAFYAAYSPNKFARKEVELNQDNKKVLAMMLNLKRFIAEDEKLKKSAEIVTDEAGVIMRVPNGQLFEGDTATLKPGASEVLDGVIKILKEQNYDLVVRGNTDDKPVTSPAYASNWELSAARAAATLSYILAKSKISPTRLKAAGFADTRPLMPNNNDTNRAINRRTEFYFHLPAVKSW